MNIQCNNCGKFCRPVDSGVYYGGYLDIEPPDPLYFCKKCVKKELEHPERVIVKCWWIKPNYVSIVKSINRHKKYDR
jgi:hypothetical protein